MIEQSKVDIQTAEVHVKLLLKYSKSIAESGTIIRTEDTI